MLVKQLQQIGLTEKEAKVYVGVLELGEATAQEISQTTGLNRATAYLTLESLLKRQLLNRINKHKKVVFTLEHPLQILDLLHKEKQDVEIRINLAKELMPELEMLEKVTGERAKVRFFEGKEGVQMIQKDIIRSNQKIVDGIFNLNDALKNFPVSDHDHRQIIRKKKIGGRSIAIYNPKLPIPYLPPVPSKEIRYLPENKLPFKAEIVMYGDKAAILSVGGKLMGIILQNKAIVDGFRYLFELAWQGSAKYSVIKGNKKS